MGIFAGLLAEQRQSLSIERRNSLDNPSIPLSLASFLGWLGGGEPTAAGEVINVQSALQVTDLYIATRCITEAVASLPIYVYELKDDGTKERVDHDLTWILANEPNDEMAAPPFWESQVGAMALAGNSYAEIMRDGAGRPRGLYPLSPGVTAPKREPQSGKLVYVTTSGMPDARERVIQKEDICHCPLFCFDGLKGFSPVTLARQTLGLGKAAEKFGARLFGNGAVPFSVFTPEAGNRVTPDDAARLKESFERNYGGENQLRTAVLTGAWKLQQLGLDMEDCQFILTQQFTRTRIAALMRVPPHMIGDTTRLSNKNHENETLQFVIDCLRAYLTRIEKELTRKLFPRLGPKAYRYVVEFDVTERERGDFVTTQQGFALGRQWGWLSANDVRRARGMNPGGPELDIYLLPMNMIDARQALQAPAEPDDDGAAAVLDPNQRTILGRYAVRFGRQFVRAFRSVGSDLSRLPNELKPVIAAMADSAITRDPFEPADDGIAERIASEVMDGVMRRLKRRGAAWVFSQELCRDEFRRAMRAIHIRAAKESAAITAGRQLAAESEENGNAD